MTVAASGVVLSNLMYLIGAVLLMVVLIMIIVLRQRKPKSVEANMESFHRGLRALAPSATSPKRQSVATPTRPAARRSQVQTVVDAQPEPTTEAGTG
ncbi:hypothetical protein K6U06_12095 [Acidiferrimicrobium sp. IK]|uniref:hypothetical protein n=1 Tax=Acidiferrimicrobium sp. IK TaxID=2871700 RepID=UPI0021CB6AA8|nr:hypothetical protein [Acidiferrimicrobium sp. IK]MCU4185106.1 hypothetical protein [Acidiferrimicrobium sp. IK]